jgi:hypothetical protein
MIRRGFDRLAARLHDPDAAPRRRR